MTALSGRTSWSAERAPLRLFIRTETGSAVVLLVAGVAALVWANVDCRHTSVCGTQSLRFESGTGGPGSTRVTGVNSGLHPDYFINGHRHHCAFDLETLSAAAEAAGIRAALTH